jgi:hypothetical protein
MGSDEVAALIPQLMRAFPLLPHGMTIYSSAVFQTLAHNMSQGGAVGLTSLSVTVADDDSLQLGIDLASVFRLCPRLVKLRLHAHTADLNTLMGIARFDSVFDTVEQLDFDQSDVVCDRSLRARTIALVIARFPALRRLGIQVFVSSWTKDATRAFCVNLPILCVLDTFSLLGFGVAETDISGNVAATMLLDKFPRMQFFTMSPNSSAFIRGFRCHLEQSILGGNALPINLVDIELPLIEADNESSYAEKISLSSFLRANAMSVRVR